MTGREATANCEHAPPHDSRSVDRTGPAVGAENPRRLRLAHVIGYPNIGGAERQFVDLLNAMPGADRLAVFTSADRGGGDLRGVLDPAIEQVEVLVRRRSLIAGLRRLAAVLRSCRCDVVHTHMYTANLYGSLAAKLAGVPVVVTTEHGENRWKGPYHRFVERRIISRIADRRLCVSEAILRRRADYEGVPRGKLALMANGTVMPELESGSRDGSVLTVGAVGRMVPQKDYPSLLRAMAQLRDAGRRFRLCLIGDGPELPGLRQVAADLELEEFIEFTGAINGVDAWYRKFDLFVMSSVQEGLPLALLEAMSYAIPCVATDVGAIGSALANDVEGTIVPPGNPLVLAAAIDRYFQEPALRTMHGDAARSRVCRDFSIEAAAGRHLDLYRELLKEKAIHV